MKKALDVARVNWAPVARILLRYGVGFAIGRGLGEELALDPDVVLLTSLAIGGVVEILYTVAKRKGWTT